MTTVKCYEASDGKLFLAADFEQYKSHEKMLKMKSKFFLSKLKMELR